MRIPAVAIAAAFTGGILLGRELHMSRSVLGVSFLVVFFLLIAALLFASSAKLWTAAGCSLFGWVCVGAIGMCAASRPVTEGWISVAPDFAGGDCARREE
jgi:hypothetical protein